MTPANDNLPHWPRGLTRTRAAAYIGVPLGTFNKMIDANEMPKPKRVYGRVLFDRLAVDKAFNAVFGTDSGDEEIIDFAA